MGCNLGVTVINGYEAWLDHGFKLIEILSELYVIESVILDLLELGWPCRRRRRISLLFHKRHVVVRVQKWSEELVRSCCRTLAITFAEFLLSGPAEHEAELQWAESRQATIGTLPEYALDHAVQTNRWKAAVTVQEYKHLRAYQKMAPKCCYQLQQDPAFTPNKSCTRALQCQIKNQSMVWCDVVHRWLMPFELLLLQGFPVYPQARLYGETTPWDGPCAERNTSRTIEQSGNSMPVPLIGLAMIYCLGMTDVAAVSSTSSSCVAEPGLESPSATVVIPDPDARNLNKRVAKRLRKSLSLG